MAFTYLVLNLLFMACIIVLLVRSIRKPSATWLITLGGLLILTLIFDNLAIWAGIFTYSPEKILGIYLGFAPVEDFFYAVCAVIIIPLLWKWFERVEKDRHDTHS